MLEYNVDYAKKLDCYFLKDILIDEELLSWEPGKNAKEITRKIIELFQTFKEEPVKITTETVEDIVLDDDSEIGRPEFYLAHIKNAAGIYQGLSEALLNKDSKLDVPEPKAAFARGLIHDIDSTYSDYTKTGQQTKQNDLYFHARHLVIPEISHEIAMHCGYLEVLEMIYEGKDFPKSEAYNSLREFLYMNGNYKGVFSEFEDFRKGKEILPLIALSVADYLSLDNVKEGSDFFDINKFEEDFGWRAKDIVNRYYKKPIEDGKHPTALGTALEEKGGYERMLNNKGVVYTLLTGSSSDISELKEKNPLLWKP